jgi:hypothetical protein
MYACPANRYFVAGPELIRIADVEELQKKKQSDIMRFLMRVRVRQVTP